MSSGEKVNYARFISNPPPDLEEALARIVPRIDLAKINAFIGDVPYLTDLQRDFYRTYLAARFAALFAALGR